MTHCRVHFRRAVQPRNSSRDLACVLAPSLRKEVDAELGRIRVFGTLGVAGHEGAGDERVRGGFGQVRAEVVGERHERGRGGGEEGGKGRGENLRRGGGGVRLGPTPSSVFWRPKTLQHARPRSSPRGGMRLRRVGGSAAPACGGERARYASRSSARLPKPCARPLNTAAHYGAGTQGKRLGAHLIRRVGARRGGKPFRDGDPGAIWLGPA